MFCSKCGKQLDEGARFCRSCGTPVAGAVAASQQPESTPAPTNAPDSVWDSDATNVIVSATPDLAGFDVIGVDQGWTTTTVMGEAPAAAGAASFAGGAQPAPNAYQGQRVQSPYQSPQVQQTQKMPQPPYQAPQAQQPYQGQHVQQPYQGQPSYQQSAYRPQTPYQQKPDQGKSKSGVIIGVIAAIVVVAAVLVVLFVFPGVLKGNDASNNSASAPSATQQQDDQGTGASSNANNSGDADAQDGADGADSADATNSSGSGDKPDAEPAAPASTFDEKAAEEEAREAALMADKQVFTGTVRTTNYYDRAQEIDSRLAQDFSSMKDKELVLLELDHDYSIEARSSGDMGFLTTRSGGDTLSLLDEIPWSDYEGQKITVAVHAADMWYPSDVAGALYTVTARNAVVIAPLTEENADAVIRDAGTLSDETRAAISDIEETERKQAAENSEYVIPDSANRTLSRSELESYSNLELYRARNEIYARHGRMFNNQDLQAYFDGKSWYHGTVAPGDFDDNLLSQTERDNVALMLEIEQDRNSPYLS